MEDIYHNSTFCFMSCVLPGRSRTRKEMRPYTNEVGEASRFALACIAHKSLEICERCRLWQLDSPAEPEIPLLLERRFKNSLFRFIYYKIGSQTAAQRLFESILARNELVDPLFCAIFAG